MTMNKCIGNMYPWATHTENFVKGKCPHGCVYCSIEDMAKRYNRPQKPMHLDRKTFKDNLGKGNLIFVGSSTDMFADCVKKDWIIEVLEYCKVFDNIYLFQTKNPRRLLEFKDEFPKRTYLGITLETNRKISYISQAPSPLVRTREFCKLDHNKKMVSIEPIIDFDLEEFVLYIKMIKPKFVSIGADSKGHHLPEPDWDKIQNLIKQLEKFTEVKIKSNLNRLNK